jgi:hypothetical protein
MAQFSATRPDSPPAKSASGGARRRRPRPADRRSSRRAAPGAIDHRQIDGDACGPVAAMPGLRRG